MIKKYYTFRKTWNQALAYTTMHKVLITTSSQNFAEFVEFAESAYRKIVRIQAFHYQ